MPRTERRLSDRVKVTRPIATDFAVNLMHQQSLLSFVAQRVDRVDNNKL